MKTVPFQHCKPAEAPDGASTGEPLRGPEGVLAAGDAPDAAPEGDCDAEELLTGEGTGGIGGMGVEGSQLQRSVWQRTTQDNNENENRIIRIAKRRAVPSFLTSTPI